MRWAVQKRLEQTRGTNDMDCSHVRTDEKEDANDWGNENESEDEKSEMQST